MNARRTVLNISIEDTDIRSFLQSFTHGSVFTVNIDHFVLLQEDEAFYLAYKSCDHVVLDSRVLYLLAAFVGRPFRGVVHGSDLLPAFCRHHRDDPAVKIFLCGGTEAAILQLKDRLNAEAGRELIVGAYAPPFGFDTDTAGTDVLIDRIRTSGATVLAMGVGSPKQELWIHRNRDRLRGIGRILAVGAAIDFMTGVQKRAPEWIRMIGMEWLYRLIREPRRFAVRYLVRDMRFFYYLTKELHNTYSNPFSQQGPSE